MRARRGVRASSTGGLFSFLANSYLRSDMWIETSPKGHQRSSGDHDIPMRPLEGPRSARPSLRRSRGPLRGGPAVLRGQAGAGGVAADGQQLGRERCPELRQHVRLRAGQAGAESAHPGRLALLRRQRLGRFWPGARGRHRGGGRPVRLHHRSFRRRPMRRPPRNAGRSGRRRSLDARRRRRQPGHRARWSSTRSRPTRRTRIASTRRETRPAA